ncbi:MAG TPA: Gfo/Idh/MocA family oxidoreductase, partial [Nitrobacter sp.]|nr:Gfo/Idh/MocA family oxidoreductase [Nitrobacter sp.]
MSAATRIGIIGLGRMGQNHARVLSTMKGADLVAVFDVDANRTAEVAMRHATCAAASAEELLGGVEAVVIASPTTSHADYVQKAAGRIRKIFVEKPLTDASPSSKELTRLAEENGIRLQVGFIERFNPALVQLAGLLESSEQVISLDIFRTNRVSERITDVDVVTDLMIHDLDLALHLNGPVAEAVADGIARGSMIDFANATLRHENGRISRIQASRITDRKSRRVEATCADCFVECDLLRREITVSRQARVEQKPGQPYR